MNNLAKKLQTVCDSLDMKIEGDFSAVRASDNLEWTCLRCGHRGTHKAKSIMDRTMPHCGTDGRTHSRSDISEIAGLCNVEYISSTGSGTTQHVLYRCKTCLRDGDIPRQKIIAASKSGKTICRHCICSSPFTLAELRSRVEKYGIEIPDQAEHKIGEKISARCTRCDKPFAATATDLLRMHNAPCCKHRRR